MPSASEFSTTPASNTTIGGVNTGEGCSPGGLNDAIRYIAATTRDTYDRIPATGALMPKTGGTFEGDIARQGKGGYVYHAASGATGGMYFLPEGSARPAAVEGVSVFYY